MVLVGKPRPKQEFIRILESIQRMSKMNAQRKTHRPKKSEQRGLHQINLEFASNRTIVAVREYAAQNKEDRS